MGTVLVRVLQKNRAVRSVIYKQAHTVVGADIPMPAGQAPDSLETRGQTDVTGQLQRQSVSRISSSSDDFSLIALRLSTNEMRPTHIMKSDLVHSKSVNLNMNYT